jgi:signal transduction histidine kinase
MRAHEMLAELMRAIQVESAVYRQPMSLRLCVKRGLSCRSRPEEREFVGNAISARNEIYADVHAPSLFDALRMLGMNAIDVCGPNDAVCWRCDVVVDSVYERVRITLSDTGPGLSREAAAIGKRSILQRGATWSRARNLP